MTASSSPPESGRRPEQPKNAEQPTKTEPHGIVPRALAHFRWDPLLLLPFALAGLILAILDFLHRGDPVPAIEHSGLGEHTVSVEYAGYPTGLRQMTVPLESLLGLELPYLVWSLGLYALGLLAVTVAGAVTIRRALTGETSLDVDSVASLFGFVLAMDLLQRVLGSVDLLQGMGPIIGIPVLVLYFYVMIRLFVAPGLLVAGWAPRDAIRGSDWLTTGSGWSLAAVVFLVGLLAWLLGSVPTIGAFPSTAVVAPIHAVAIVAVLEREDVAGTLTDGGIDRANDS